MAQSIYSGVCVDGPLQGHFHRQITHPPTQAGVFNFIGLGGVRGSYSFSTIRCGWVWSDQWRTA